MGKIKDFTGMRFGRLLVVEFLGIDKGATWFECLCDCGSKHITRRQPLVAGSTKSCGCLLVDAVIARNTTHGLSKSSFYISWRHMISRCHKPNSESYKWYGARGIEVCGSWHIFENFLKDMYGDYKIFLKSSNTRNTTIDRIDVNGNYCKENCRWTSMMVQGHNRRNNNNITFNNKTQCLVEWARELNMDNRTLNYRIQKGWSTEAALTTPINLAMSRKKYDIPN
jgi:hypothetical protein